MFIVQNSYTVLPAKYKNVTRDSRPSKPSESLPFFPRSEFQDLAPSLQFLTLSYTLLISKPLAPFSDLSLPLSPDAGRVISLERQLTVVSWLA